MVDTRRPFHVYVADPGERGDQRRDASPRVDEGLEGAELLAAADPKRTDFADLVLGAGAGGLQIDDAERDVVEGLAEVLKGTLAKRGGAGPAGAHPPLRGRPDARLLVLSLPWNDRHDATLPNVCSWAADFWIGHGPGASGRCKRSEIVSVRPTSWGVDHRRQVGRWSAGAPRPHPGHMGRLSRLWPVNE